MGDMNSDIHKKVKRYFSLLAPHQEAGNLNLRMTFDKGYWWCESHKEINELEREFLGVGKSDEVLKALADSKNKKITELIHLLGWSCDTKSAGKILERYLFSDNIEWVNAAARALFPMIAAGKYRMDIKNIFALLHKRSKFCKNKAMGILAFYPTNDLNEAFPLEERNYIKKLSHHSDTLIIANAAKMVLRRW